MMPWERDIYVDQLRQFIEDQNLKNMQEEVNARSNSRSNR